MKENIDNAIQWLKKQPVKGCITGSILLGEFENQDIDIFVYDEKSFTKLLYAMHYDNMFHILDPLEQWKFDQQTTKNYDNFQKFGLCTIKFKYNTCLDVNVILKKQCTNIFSVLASFDMDIIAKGYDIQSEQYLDLSENKDTKIATWNKWNTSYYSGEIWQVSRLLRQLMRCFKYHDRGYNTDLVVKKYMSLVDTVQDYENIFNSDSFSETLKLRKTNTKIVKDICKIWLKEHKLTEKNLELMKTKIKEL